jgi:hypothetical protein
VSADSQTPPSVQVGATAGPGPDSEPHAANAAGRLNWLRAGVLGANDGIVSVAGIVVGVAGATSARGPIFTAGLAGLVAGAVSMALGEYVSVSSQRDSQDTLLAQEARELAESPEQELAELTNGDIPSQGTLGGNREHRGSRAHRPRRIGRASGC